MRLQERQALEKINIFTYRYLNAHSPNPKAEGIFSLPLVREVLGRMRSEMLVGKPALTPFDKIVGL